MTSGLQAICAHEMPCKCCGASAVPYGVVDFNKNCELFRRNALGISCVPIYYHRCRECRFIFTTALDHFTEDDFRRYVYNDEYPLIDPDYAEERPTKHAALLLRLFAGARPERILDYGGGNGLLADLLRAGGFSDVETYDPFVPRFSARPADRFDCIVCFEVFEHSTVPDRTLADIAGFLTDSGFIILSTLLQPDDIDKYGLNWWYAAPRNAHVSLYSSASLQTVVRRLGFEVASLSQSYHVLYRQVPDFMNRSA
jgi:2-polyprenyl-6-hydroxyphenyl methylase/3-demethylubiquinone-9 3-methyltransferase